jgi:hypothetical protein
MARVYADVNANMPRSYWDYDSVNISWGVLENYEVVRKIGVSGRIHRICLRMIMRANMKVNYRSRQVLRSVRGHQYCQLPEMRHKSAQAGQEEEDKT